MNRESGYEKFALVLKTNIMHHGRWNRSGRPGNRYRRTNVCCMVPKMPTDAISEALNFKIPELQVKLVAMCRMHPLKLI